MAKPELGVMRYATIGHINTKPAPASKRSSTSSAPGAVNGTRKPSAPKATQLPNRPMQPLRPSRTVDPETERAELMEASLLLHTRTLLSQVSGVPLDQIHTLIS